MPRPSVTKSEQKRYDQAWRAFNDHYECIWSSARWAHSLYPALAASQRYVALVNHFASISEGGSPLGLPGAGGFDRLILPIDEVKDGASAQNLECLLPHVSSDPSELGDTLLPAPTVAHSKDPSKRLLTHWKMDASSALVVHALDVQPGQTVLDMCAAPGGKSVAIAQHIWPSLHSNVPQLPPSEESRATRGCLHVNEYDPARSTRLAQNLKSYLPSKLILSGAVRLLRADAAQHTFLNKLPEVEGGYDRILVDAPCSAERHLVHAHCKGLATRSVPPEISNWKPASSQNLARTQVALLMNALRLLRIGGRVAYATCSIETQENDGVVRKCLAMLDKEFRQNKCNWHIVLHSGGKAHAEALKSLDEFSEPTTYGRIVLPDHPSGGRWGPLYFTVLSKVAIGTAT